MGFDIFRFKTAHSQLITAGTQNIHKSEEINRRLTPSQTAVDFYHYLLESRVQHKGEKRNQTKLYYCCSICLGEIYKTILNKTITLIMQGYDSPIILKLLKRILWFLRETINFKRGFSMQDCSEEHLKQGFWHFE